MGSCNFILIFYISMASQDYFFATTVTANPLSNDFNILINGFKNCLLEVVFPKQVQDFEEPPQTPVTISFVKNKNSSALIKLEVVIKSNCFALVLLSQNSKRNNINLFDFSQLFTFYGKVGHSYSKRTYLIIYKDGRMENKNELLNIPFNLTVSRNPIFYYTVSRNHKIKIGVGLHDPCEFQVEDVLLKDYLIHTGSSVVFHELLATGLRNHCKGITWVLADYMNKPGSSGYCIPASLSSLSSNLTSANKYTLTLLSILAEPFPNSTILKLGGMDRRSSCPSYKHVILVNTLFKTDDYSKRDIGECYDFFHKVTSYNFITCDGLENQLLSFKAYVSPFQSMVWICIIVIFVCVSIFLSGLFKWIYLQDNPPFTLLSILLEQPVSTAVSRGAGMKILLASVYMTSVVLTNSYRGIVTTSLTFPVTPKSLETFDEALVQGYNFLQVLPPYSVTIYNHSRWNALNSNASHQVALDFLNNIAFFKASISATLKLNSSVDLKFRKKLKDVTTRLRLPQNFPNMTSEIELSKCNKTIYVDFDDNLDQIIFNMKSSDQANKMYRGKESFLKQSYAWRMERIDWDQNNVLEFRSQAITSSGIEQYWDNRLQVQALADLLRKLDNSTDEDGPQPLTKKFLLSILLIYLSLLSLSLGICMVESFVVTCFLSDIWRWI